MQAMGTREVSCFLAPDEASWKKPHVRQLVACLTVIWTGSMFGMSPSDSPFVSVLLDGAEISDSRYETNAPRMNDSEASLEYVDFLMLQAWGHRLKCDSGVGRFVSS
jgi:hypothetical protein